MQEEELQVLPKEVAQKPKTRAHKGGHPAGVLKQSPDFEEVCAHSPCGTVLYTCKHFFLNKSIFTAVLLVVFSPAAAVHEVWLCDCYY